MATPRIDFNLFGINWLPISRRKRYFIAWIQFALSGLVRLQSINQKFQDGTDALEYFDNSITYSKEDEVNFKRKSYKSLKNLNLGNNPETSPEFWQLTQNSIVGMNERSSYSFQKLTVEYALNHYFAKEILDAGFVGFVQIDSATSPTNSTIYIEDFAIVNKSIVIWNVRKASNTIWDSPRNYYVFDTLLNGAPSTYKFVVKIPSTVFVLINSDSVLAEKIVRDFVKKYTVSGVTFEIQTY